ncbi:uncharacterized protein BXZ73DRAFT_73451 [Epithele typhae]|uniref:uncharacterized protein n=1 Tax=Epithele typhae TaxID=378194 RepID=UPI0020076FA4|nr:uncharacterized protein BXZ73DRAFT_73451 [Epithele typhae]KAH9945291.1 hypothetical protein BXZ73DRAFT_73451 [Epithele typhae]
MATELEQLCSPSSPSLQSVHSDEFVQLAIDPDGLPQASEPIDSEETAPLVVRSKAPSPFDKPDAGIVLGSLDAVGFHVRKEILLEASPVFERLLASEGSPTILDIPAASDAIELILRICYPIITPRLTDLTLDLLQKALRLGMDYALVLPTAVIEDEMVARACRISQWPQVWLVACRNRLEDVARRLLDLTFDNDALDPFTPLLTVEAITSGDYHRCWEYRRARGNVTSSFQLWKCDTKGSTPTAQTHPAPIVYAFETTFPEADLIFQSSDGIMFHANEARIRKASPSLHAYLEAAPRGVSRSDLQKSRTKGKGKKASVYRFLALATEDPIYAYLLAAVAGLDTLSKRLAKLTLKIPLCELYVEHMQRFPAGPYHRLIKYREACSAAGKRLLLGITSRTPHPSVVVADPLHVHEAAEAQQATLTVNITPETVLGPSGVEAWLQYKIQNVAATIEDTPGYMFSPQSPEAVWEQALTASELWCGNCRGFAGQVHLLGKALQDMPSVVDEIEF